MYVTGFLILLSTVSASAVLVAFDCNQQQINMTSISLVTTPSCSNDDRNVTVTRERVTITQTTLFRTVKYHRCMVTTLNSVFRCGKMIDTSHRGSIFSEILKVTEEECLDIINKGKYRYSSGTNALDITVDQQVTKLSFVSRGYIKDGSCEPGTPFSRDGIFYDRPVVNTEITIRYQTGEALVDLEENLIRVEGKGCNLQQEKCFDVDLGYVFWKTPKPDCSGSEPKSAIYEGIAEVVTEEYGDRYIQVTHSGYDFQILVKNETTYLCGLLTWYTEHPRLFVTFLNQGQPSLNLKYPVQSKDVSMLNYINSKIVYSFRHIRDNVLNLFKTFKQDRCKTHNRITENLMTLATTSPKEFAYAYGGPGYTATTRGEVVYLAKCSPVVVSPDLEREGCYNELPVKHHNKTMFVSPRSRILIPVGTKLDCLPDMMPKYNIDGKWYHTTVHGLMQSPAPHTISPEPIDYTFEPLAGIGNGGLYSSAMIEKYQQAVVAPAVQGVITARVVSSVSGESKMPEGYSFVRGFDTTDFSIIEEKVGGIWSQWSVKLKESGSWYAAILLLFALYRALICAISCFVNFRALKEDVGMLLAIPLCLVDAIASLVLHGRLLSRVRKTRRPGDADTSDPEKGVKSKEEELELVARGEGFSVYKE
ncbi:putative glycoprotein 2 [Anopheles marajoara virus]|uniref:Glycoprotein 2 n=1 Tax=Anopheles marajoara virus TaxID=2546225 RepID=A0AAE5YGK1_9MONO|nr:putative glycoprotein 2 [Anopheles marajoara virus]QBK47214.1 putative glycoprotein 2 [Anopheles marajoara virus]